MKPSFLAFVLCIAGAVPACSSCAERSSSETAPAESASAATSASSAASTRGDDEVKPVYPVTNAPPDPLADRLCGLLHDLPAKRKADCCSTTPGFSIAKECTRTLTAALNGKAVTLDSADVDRCAAALEKSLEGCGWVGPTLPAVPAECDGIIHGTLEQGTRCRSSLECKDGLRCQGAGPTDLGKCGPPRKRGPCITAVDTLASYTRQDSFESKHPECEGYCAGRLCNDVVPAGGTCTSSVECGPNRACVAGRCSDAPLPVAGAPCMGGVCAAGLRCIKNACVAPKGEGEACEMDAECRSGCVRPDGGTNGTCGKKCSLL